LGYWLRGDKNGSNRYIVPGLDSYGGPETEGQVRNQLETPMGEELTHFLKLCPMAFNFVQHIFTGGKQFF